MYLSALKGRGRIAYYSVLMRIQTFAHNLRTFLWPGRRRGAGRVSRILGKRRIEGALLTRRKLRPGTRVFSAWEKLIRICSHRKQVRRLKRIQHRAMPIVNVCVATPREGTNDPRNKEKLSHTTNPPQKGTRNVVQSVHSRQRN